MSAISSRSAALKDLSFCELLSRFELGEIMQRISTAVVDFFTRICEKISEFLNWIGHRIADTVDWMFFNSAAETARQRAAREAAAEAQRQRILANARPRHSVLFPFVLIRILGLSPIIRLYNQDINRILALSMMNQPSNARASDHVPAPGAAQNVGDCAGTLQEAIAPYQTLPSHSPAFEKEVLNIAKEMLSAKDIENIEDASGAELFCLLLVRAVVFQARSLHFDATAAENVFNVPDYFKVKTNDGSNNRADLSERLKTVRASFWRLDDSEKLAILSHIDTEITRNGNNYQLHIATEDELPQIQAADPVDVKKRKQEALEVAKNYQDRRIKPADARISDGAADVYKEMREIAARLHQGNQDFMEAYQKAIQ